MATRKYLGKKTIKQAVLKGQLIIPIEMEVQQVIHQYEDGENPAKKSDQPEIQLKIIGGESRGEMEKQIEMVIRQFLLDNGFSTKGLRSGGTLSIGFSYIFTKDTL